MNGVIITGNTPKVSNVCLYDNIIGHDLAKDLHHKGFYTNAGTDDDWRLKILDLENGEIVLSV